MKNDRRTKWVKPKEAIEALRLDLNRDPSDDPVITVQTIYNAVYEKKIDKVGKCPIFVNLDQVLERWGKSRSA